MTKRIEETLEVIEEVQALYDSGSVTPIRVLRTRAVNTVAKRRGIKSQTVRDKFIRQLEPEIRTASAFDSFLEKWLRSDSEELKGFLSGHTSDQRDKQAIDDLFARNATSRSQQDEKEQIELQESIEAQTARGLLTRDDIIKELASVTPQTQVMTDYRGRRYKRDNKTIAQLKVIRGYRCQLCGTSIRKKKGGFYVEAAHITAKSSGGPELPRNILVLCPNHHKEFDLGERRILTSENGVLHFQLNGQDYKIDLSLK